MKLHELIKELSKLDRMDSDVMLCMDVQHPAGFYAITASSIKVFTSYQRDKPETTILGTVRLVEGKSAEERMKA